MIKIGRRGRFLLAAPVMAAIAGLGLTVPAQAQASPPSRVAGTPVATNAPVTSKQSLQALVGHAPAGGKRWVVNDSVAYGQAVKSEQWVRTPSGLSNTGCVFHVPAKATVRNGLITLPSGATHQLKPCEYPTLAYPASAKTSSAKASSAKASSAGPSATKPTAAPVTPAGGPCSLGSGGVYWAASCYGSQPTWVTSMVQDQAVPNNPAKTGALIFLWGGLEDANGDTLLQDVLTWGANGSIVTNPDIWYVTPWYLWGNNSVIGASIHVHPLDTIVQSLTASNCSSSGDCTWVLEATDTTLGSSTSYTVGSEVPFTLVLGAVMEVPGNNACVEMPAGGHAAFRNLVMAGNTGTVTPAWGNNTPDPHCSVSITTTSNSADILWKTS
jgi:hypothetical protein